tara:strand:- start:892 stop:1572 length:681 start_codon:yes stop_codon:yes gene_type:complete
MGSDPLALGDLEPSAIASAVESKSKGKVKPPSELDLKKEERLAQKEQRLATGKANAATSGPSVPPPPIDPGPLLDKLLAYKERFPHLKSRNKINAKSSIEEIEDELHYCEMQLGSSNTDSMGSMLFVGSMVGLETFTRDVYNPLKLNLNGLGQVAKDNVDDFKDVIDELVIKYGASFHMAPEYRLVLSVGALVMTVHSANSGDPRVGESLNRMKNIAKPPQGYEGM